MWARVRLCRLWAALYERSTAATVAVAAGTSRRITAFTATKPTYAARSATPAGGRPTWLAQHLVAIATATSLATFHATFHAANDAAVAAAGRVFEHSD